MSETCSCGAFIQTLSFRRVKLWRKEHRHDAASSEPDKQGATASTERAPQFDHDQSRPITARIGFVLGETSP